MRFMNQWEVEDAALRYRDHRVLGPATRTLENLVDWANLNSDGWAYWPKPARAAAKLMEMITRDGTSRYRGAIREDVSAEEYRQVLSPIKSFRTKHNADFEIEEIAS